MIDSTCENYFPINKKYLLWVTINESGQVWYITSDLHRNQYFLFKGDEQTKYKSENPNDLYKYIKE